MSRFYVPKESVRGRSISIGGKEAHHITDVMRLRPSDTIVAFDGSGKEYAGCIKSVRAGKVNIEILRVIEPETAVGAKVTLIQAIPKKAKMDYITEKATELGVWAIVPVTTQRTIPDWDDRKKTACVARWRKIALETSKQCSRRVISSVSDIMDFSEAVKDAGRYGLKLLPTLGHKTVPLRDAVAGFCGKSVAVAIGPEGDFTPDEVKLAEGIGYVAVSLGARVLKSDTAGLAVLAILDYELSKQTNG